MAEKRRPIHLAVAVGVSASLYAVSLAGVTALQSNDNAQVAAGHAPLIGTVDGLDSANSDLEARLAAARKTFDASAAKFSSVADRVTGFESRLKALAGNVAKIRGTSISMPSGGGGAVQHVSSAGSGPVAKPPVHTTTTASGH